MKPIRFHPDAEVELADAAQYYEQSRSGLGVDFLTEVELVLGQLTATPEAFPQISKRTRRKSLWRFPYNLIYAIYPDRLRIIAVAHQKRRPFYWRIRTLPGMGS